MTRTMWLSGVAVLVAAGAGFAQQPEMPKPSGKEVAAAVTFARVLDGKLADVRTAVHDTEWHLWVPFLEASACHKDGDAMKRVCTIKGSRYKLTETITKSDGKAGVFAYTIDNPPLPVKGAKGTLTTKEMDGKVLLTWTLDYTADEAQNAVVREMVVGMYAGAADGLQAFVRKK
jgi:Polyketide cyclase / dehydrase and lipid transport